jgi:hypothetical protein
MSSSGDRQSRRLNWRKKRRLARERYLRCNKRKARGKYRAGSRRASFDRTGWELVELQI